MVKIYGIAGWKNSGKTTLTERLVAHYAAAGLIVSTLKHAHHAFDVDHPGRDSYRHRSAGARQVLVVSDQRMALMTEFRGAPEPDLATLLARMDPADLILAEGFKTAPMPRIEVHRAATGTALLALTDAHVRAVASDSAHPGLAVPVYDLDDVAGIAAFIAADLGL